MLINSSIVSDKYEVFTNRSSQDFLSLLDETNALVMKSLIKPHIDCLLIFYCCIAGLHIWRQHDCWDTILFWWRWQHSCALQIAILLQRQRICRKLYWELICGKVSCSVSYEHCNTLYDNILTFIFRIDVSSITVDVERQFVGEMILTDVNFTMSSSYNGWWTKRDSTPDKTDFDAISFSLASIYNLQTKNKPVIDQLTVTE